MATPGKECLSSISGYTLEKAKRELFEVPEEREEKTRQLRLRIDRAAESSEFKDIVFKRRDRKFLLRFLRARKFDVEKSLQLYLNYYKYRHKHAHHLGQLSPQAVDHVLRTNMFALLDAPMNSGSKVIVLFPSRHDLDKIPPSEVFKTVLLILDRLIEDEEIQVHGLSLIMDNEDLSLYSVMKASTSEFARTSTIYELIQDAFPARFKSCHLVRQPWYFTIIYKLVRPFLKEKFKERIHMHGWDMDSLYDFIPRSKLPTDFGGPLPPLSSSSIIQLFEEELSN